MDHAQRIHALQVEADRLKARLDQFDRQLRGDPDAWIEIVTRMPPTVAEVVVDRVLAEARQTALAYATVVKTLASLSEEAPNQNSGDPLDEIAKKRREKESDLPSQAQAK